MAQLRKHSAWSPATGLGVADELTSFLVDGLDLDLVLDGTDDCLKVLLIGLE